jgi:hypothetical protein
MTSGPSGTNDVEAAMKNIKRIGNFVLAIFHANATDRRKGDETGLVWWVNGTLNGD